VAGPTGLEPATSNVTGWRSNQLNYDPALEFEIGGHEGTRTPNFLLVREAVYQLTYMPKLVSGSNYRRDAGAKIQKTTAFLSERRT
jgi:hypothetical protein